jgi:hypothetical protein
LLISGVTAVSRNSSGDPEVPSYRSIPYSNPEAIFAALGRRAFTSAEGEDPDSVTYIHRTVAEYLAARWIGRSVANGLPIARVQALLGVDFRPAPSLRGLHAWLPLFVPKEAASLIANDPLGIVTYGDAASLQPSQKTVLIGALARLAVENPWFLWEGFSDYGLAGLSSPETAEQLLDIIHSADASTPLKTLVLHAIAAGQPLEKYRAPLELLLANAAAPAAHRQTALEALLKYGASAIPGVVSIYKATISAESESIGLRSAVVGLLYGRSFGPKDAVAILNDAATRSRVEAIGDLWQLEQGIPDEHLLDLLEEYERQTAARKVFSPDSFNYDVPVTVERMIGRLCGATPHGDIERVDRLMSLLRKIYEKNLTPPGAGSRIGAVLSDQPALARALAESAVRHMDRFENPELVGITMNRITQGAITVELMAEILLAGFTNE